MTTYFNDEEKIDDKTLERVTPCPFCGVRPEVMTSGEGSRGLMIHCISAKCANPSVSYYDHETALEVWNQRDGRPPRRSRP